MGHGYVARVHGVRLWTTGGTPLKALGVIPISWARNSRGVQGAPGRLLNVPKIPTLAQRAMSTKLGPRAR